MHTVVCSCRPRPGFLAQHCWCFRRAGSLLWGPVLSVIGCLLAASLLGARDPSPPHPTPPPWRPSELFPCLVSPGRPNRAWLRTTGVDLPLLELETAVSAKNDMRDKG